MFGGDIVMKHCTPSLVGGGLQRYLEVLGRLRELGAERIVPGHGPICGVEALDEIERYVRFVGQLADEGVAAGAEPFEVAEGAPLGEFSDWCDAERLVGNLHRAYAEHPDVPKNTVDFPTVWEETERFLGGPLTSHA